MSSYVIAPPTQPSLPVVGTDKLFPVRRVYCVGRNYAEHTREMGHDPNKEAPFFFMKTPDSLLIDGKFPYPTVSTDVHWEIELVVALKSGGKNIKAADALAHVFGYAIALDMTRRDLQGEAKKTGRPWEIGKAFDYSTPCTPLSPVEKVGHLARGAITRSERRSQTDGRPQ
jgi:fumarylpyruvate hydrolase